MYKVPKCGVACGSIFSCIRTEHGDFSGLYYPVFGPGKTPHLDTFHAVSMNPYILGGFIYGMFEFNSKLHSAFLKSSRDRYKNVIILNK